MVAQHTTLRQYNTCTTRTVIIIIIIIIARTHIAQNMHSLDDPPVGGKCHLLSARDDKMYLVDRASG